MDLVEQAANASEGVLHVAPLPMPGGGPVGGGAILGAEVPRPVQGVGEVPLHFLKVEEVAVHVGAGAGEAAGAAGLGAVVGRCGDGFDGRLGWGEAFQDEGGQGGGVHAVLGVRIRGLSLGAGCRLLREPARMAVAMGCNPISSVQAWQAAGG